MSCVDNGRQLYTDVMQFKALARAFTKTKTYQQVSDNELQLMYFMWLFVVYSALRGKTHYFLKFFYSPTNIKMPGTSVKIIF